MRISDWSSDVCSSDLLNGISGEDTGKERDERSGDRNDQCVEHPFGERRIEYQVFEMHQRRRDHPERIAGMHAELGIRLKRRNHHPVDRKSVVYGKSVSVRVDIGGRRSLKKTKNAYHLTSKIESYIYN